MGVVVMGFIVFLIGMGIGFWAYGKGWRAQVPFYRAEEGEL